MPEEITPNPPPQEERKRVKKTLFANKTPLLVLFLLLITGALVYVALSPERETTRTTDRGTTAEALQDTILSFAGPELLEEATPSAIPTYELSVVLETEDKPVNGVQLELSYEPTTLNVLDIEAGPFIDESVEILKRIDNQRGRITFAIITPLGAPEIKGSGIVAIIKFARPADPSSEITFSFTDETVVTSETTSRNVLDGTYSTTFRIEPLEGED